MIGNQLIEFAPARGERVIKIEGEVLWAPDRSGAVVMTASFSQPGEIPRGKFVWLAAQDAYSALQLLQGRGSYLRWGPN